MSEAGRSSGRPKVLVVDDDASLAEMLQIVLHQEGFETAWCANGTTALAAFRHAQPDVVLLDLMLPGRDGIDVCRDLRRESGVPIIMLTAKSDTTDVVKGLEAGADDYVAKPFKAKELVARIRTRLRRLPIDSATDTELQIGDLQISTQSHSVHRGATEISLTPLEFDLLLALARRPRQVFSRETLLEEVWGYRHSADTRLVNVHVQRLRSKIEKDPEHPEIVITVRGIGYRAGEPLPGQRSGSDSTAPQASPAFDAAQGTGLDEAGSDGVERGGEKSAPDASGQASVGVEAVTPAVEPD